MFQQGNIVFRTVYSHPMEAIHGGIVRVMDIEHIWLSSDMCCGVSSYVFGYHLSYCGVSYLVIILHIVVYHIRYLVIILHTLFFL